MRKKILYGIAGLLFACQASAQINTGGLPASISRSGALQARQYVPKIVVAMPDVATIQRSGKASQKPKGLTPLKPMYIGALTNTDIDFKNEGSITTLADNSKIWRLQINMPGAQALGLYYDKFHLPDGVKYYLSNANGKQILGAYTIANNDPSGYWATEKVQGETINLELDIDAGVNMDDIALHINKVAEFYANIGYLATYGMTGTLEKTTTMPAYPYGGSSPCEINAVCPIADSFSMQRKASICFEYQIGQQVAAGSGTLVNNTRQDCTPYLLTASHTEITGDTTNATFAQWIFFFNYETPTCTYTGAQPVPQTMTGATFMARSAYSQTTESPTLIGDFLLLKLNQSVPAAYGACFAGWDLDTTVTTGNFIGFHHPTGDVKKVSTTSVIDPDGNFNGGITGTHWQLIWQQGGVEEGSSGSGLFNANGRLIGILSGGAVYQPTCFETGSTIHDTMLTYAAYSKLSRDWMYAYQTPSTSASRLKDWLDADNTGATSINAISANCATANVAQPEELNGKAIVYPSPTNGVAYVSVNIDEPTDLKIEVYDIIGSKVSEQMISNAITGKYKLDLANCANGTYIVSVSTNKTQTTQKVILER